MVQALTQEPVDVVDDVVIHRRPLHGPGCSLHVHQDHRGAAFGEQRCHVRVEAQSADVVHHDRAGVQGGRRDVGPVSIDRHQRVMALDNLPNNRHHTRPFYRWRYRL